MTVDPKRMPSKARILELMNYDPLTGIFTRRKKTNRNQIIGRQIGTPKREGYLMLYIDNERYYAHRIAYFILTGEQPQSVDHKNGIRTDNLGSNLRAASRCQNVYNVKRSSRNTSGYKNIHWNSRSKKWDVKINANKKYHWGGGFTSLEEAIKA